MAYLKTTVSQKTLARARRHNRSRSHMEGTSEIPRLAVFKSNRYIYAQAIDDNKGVTLAAATSLKEKKGTQLQKSEKVGEEVGKALLAKGIKAVVFDRGGFLYTGNVKAVAEGARKAGLNF